MTTHFISSYSTLSFQNALSPLMEELIFFHDHIMTLLILITLLIAYNLAALYQSSILNKIMVESQPLEMFWTVAPTLILIIIGIPSIRLLYLLDEVFNPMLTIKILGHQWYWSYEYSDFTNVLEFDSFMLNNNNTRIRLLDVDNRLIMPFNMQIRAILSATDVLHSWTIPSLGVKADAIPGRLNQINFLMNQPGVFFGQCSEICGANHSFMPIVIESVNSNSFTNWLMQNFNS